MNLSLIANKKSNKFIKCKVSTYYLCCLSFFYYCVILERIQVTNCFLCNNGVERIPLQLESNMHIRYPQHHQLRSSSAVCMKLNSKNKGLEVDDNDELTTTDSKEYYTGFISRPIVETDTERVTGDKLIDPILKFTGISAAFIGVFLLVFLASNGLI